jgi:glyoxylase-like metal-dependent hydrolase (beta-lactamase superfamily II)
VVITGSGEIKVRKIGLGFIAILLFVIPALAQQDFSKVEIKVTKVAGNVYMLEGSGGNIGVSVGPDGILIVDDEFAPLADKIKAALKGLGAGKLKFILNTHWHGDHTGGNVVFGPEAPIIAHTNVRQRLAEARTCPTAPWRRRRKTRCP